MTVKKLKHFFVSVHRSGHATGLIIPPLYPVGYLMGAGLSAAVLLTFGIIEGFDTEG